jgi:hypothetical protein
MRFDAPVVTIGWLLALVVLLICVVFFVQGDHSPLLGLVALLALARLL